MGKRVSIPVRIVEAPEHRAPVRAGRTGSPADVLPGFAPRTSEQDRYKRASRGPQPEEQGAAVGTFGETSTVAAPGAIDLTTEPAESVGTRAPERGDALQGEVDEWRDRAMRLQADMDNFRKRQQRLAKEQIETEKQRLLGAFLEVVDDLERALAVPAAPGGGLGHHESIRRGVELTHRTAMHLLQREGVEPIEAKHQRFDPNWHDAVATVGHNGSDAAADTVIEVVEPGYRLGDRLLRPAKVVVAV